MNLEGIITHERGKPLFNEISDLIRTFDDRENIENGVNLLALMNSFTDYSFSVRDGDNVNYHVFCLQNCPEWARKLVEKFIVIKLSLTSSNNHLREIAENVVRHGLILPFGVRAGTREYRRVTRRYRIFQQIYRIYQNGIVGNNDYGKSLIIVPGTDQAVNNNLIANIFADNSLVKLLAGTYEYELENEYLYDRPQLEINNLILFAPNRNFDFANSYPPNAIQRLNNAFNLGIRNCLLINLNNEPYRLFSNRIIRLAGILGENTQHLYSQANDPQKFVAFDSSETNYILSNDTQWRPLEFNVDENNEILDMVRGIILNNMPHQYRFMDLLSLCFDETNFNRLFQDFRDDISGIDGGSEIISNFYNFYSNYWEKTMMPEINALIENVGSVSFIMPRWVDAAYSNALINAFSTSNREIHINNDIDNYSQIVIFWGFQYTEPLYKSFPNSYDPLPLNPGQRGYTIINRLIFNQKYLRNQLYYQISKNGLLHSDFRVDRLSWERLDRQIATEDRINYDTIAEAEADRNGYVAEQYKIRLENNRPKNYFASDIVIYRDNESGNLDFSTVRDLVGSTGMMIQPLDEIVSQCKELITQENSNLREDELAIRRDETYNLSDDEINSDIELWRILLSKKVQENNGDSQLVFNAAGIAGHVSLNSFQRWINFDNTMILPRDRVVSDAVLRYLGFTRTTPYYWIIRKKKILRNINTREINNTISSFLQAFLIKETIDDTVFEFLSENYEDVLNSLGINSTEDLIALRKLMNLTLTNLISITKCHN